MNHFALVLLLFLSGTAKAEYIWPTAVWDQLESGSVDSIETKIERVELRDGRVLLTLGKDTDGREDQAYLCTHDKALQLPELARLAAIGMRVQSLREAAKSHDLVKLGHYGPWSPCVWPITI